MDTYKGQIIAAAIDGAERYERLAARHEDEAAMLLDAAQEARVLAGLIRSALRLMEEGKMDQALTVVENAKRVSQSYEKRSMDLLLFAFTDTPAGAKHG